MNIYIITRWGNGEDVNGPAAHDDTNFMIRAPSLARAAELADICLHWLPEQEGEYGRPVRKLASAAALLGTRVAEQEGESILSGPWYEPSNVQAAYSKRWVRSCDGNTWQPVPYGTGKLLATARGGNA